MLEGLVRGAGYRRTFSGQRRGGAVLAGKCGRENGNVKGADTRNLELVVDLFSIHRQKRGGLSVSAGA